VTPGAVAVSSTIPAATGSPAAPQRSSAAKTLLIIAGVIVAFLILGVASSVIIGMKIASRTRVKKDGDKVRVETPFGTVEANQDSDEAARNLGVDVYPGAQALKNTATTTSFGTMRTVAAQFETADPVDKVADFYKKRFPDANVTEGGSDHYTIVQTNKQGVVTVNITAGGAGTQINIANVQRGAKQSQ
jgi:hypothetical protein